MDEDSAWATLALSTEDRRERDRHGATRRSNTASDRLASHAHTDAEAGPSQIADTDAPADSQAGPNEDTPAPDGDPLPVPPPAAPVRQEGQPRNNSVELLVPLLGELLHRTEALEPRTEAPAPFRPSQDHREASGAHSRVPLSRLTRQPNIINPCPLSSMPTSRPFIGRTRSLISTTSSAPPILWIADLLRATLWKGCPECPRWSPHSHAW